MSQKIISVKRIINKFYPVFTKKGRVSKKWRKAHARANIAAREKHGKKKAREITQLVHRTPHNELLGAHTPRGNILVSKRVPKRLVPAIITHEKVEHDLMAPKKKKKYIYKK